MPRDERRAPSRAAAPQLVHPVYLDVPMLISFLAALQGGVSFEDEAVSRQSQGNTGEKEGQAKVRLPSLLSVLSLDMSGRFASKTEGHDERETRAVRRHTEASLFNILRQRLLEEGAVTDLTSVTQLDSLAPGALIEMAGEVEGNPLRQLLNLMKQIGPYMGLDVDGMLDPSKGKPKAKSRGAAKRPTGTPQANTPIPEDAEGLAMMLQLVSEVVDGSVQDSVLRGPDDVRAVLTLANEFVAASNEEYLRESEVRVLAKVTRIVGSPDGHIDLTRRTAMGLFDGEMVEQLVREAREGIETGMGRVMISDPLVRGPVVQLLPLAIFI